MAHSEGRWRDLPEQYGDHRAVKRRYSQWAEHDALGGSLTVLAADADLARLMIDSTAVRRPPARGQCVLVEGVCCAGALAASAARQ